MPLSSLSFPLPSNKYIHQYSISFSFSPVHYSKARKAVDVGSSGGTKLVGDVLKLQHDLEGILKQMKDAGMSEHAFLLT
jgi:hypothetical protein